MKLYTAYYFDNLYPDRPIEETKICLTEQEGWKFVAKKLNKHKGYSEAIRQRIKKDGSLEDLEIEMLLEVIDDPVLFQQIFMRHYAHLPELCWIFQGDYYENGWQEEYYSFGVKEQEVPISF